MSSEEKIFDKLDEMQKDISSIKTDVEVLKMREQPAYPCRAYMDSARHEIEESQKSQKYDLNNIATVNENRYKELHGKINNKVKFGFFWLIMISAFAFTAGSYVYTWNTNNRIDTLRMFDKEHENQREINEAVK